jgi:KaiC/GvpD/RAD55 family RecA-like ATPase
MPHDNTFESDPLDDSFELARFPIRLDLPDADYSLLEDAQEAVKREYRDSVKWKRLRCRNVQLLSKSETGTVFILEVGHSVEFDWTWEGAVAFRPLKLKAFEEDQTAFLDDNDDEIEIKDSILWSGEILEVDESEGKIFVCVSNPEFPPTTGSFYVRPFEFLAFLNAVYHEPAFEQIREYLPSRLLATEGDVHPLVDCYREVGLSHLKDWWGKGWSVLWGPPGTGKTFTSGHQVANVLADPSERILVVSTTNKATDAVALSIGRAAKSVATQELSGGSLLRIGKSARLKEYEEVDLTAMLKGTETEFLAQIDLLSVELARAKESESKALIRKEIKELREKMRDAAKRNFLDKNTRVVVSTAFKATTFLKMDEVKYSIEYGQTPFTTIFIDEAGLISRAAIAALSILASRRVVLVGDSKQLAPISRISRILPTNQMKWLAMSGLSHLDTVSRTIDGVHVLREQRRMHDDICQIVSAYKYDDCLVTAPEVASRSFKLPEPLTDATRAVWYVLDEDGDDLPSIRAERGPGNRSWIRTATERILDRFFAHSEFRSCDGLFISPFKAQAKNIGKFFAENDIQNWSASTVHSQQGAEADIVIFDSVNAGSYSWPYDEWQRLVNVAISRAREYVIVLSSRAEMNEPYLRPLIKHLKPRVFRKVGRKFQWEDVPVVAEYVPPKPMVVNEPSSVGYQISKRKELRPVLSNEQQRLCGLELDGKPRLVRGVAGSGKTVVLAHWLMQTVKRLQGQQNIRIWAIFANRSLQALISDSIVNAWEQETGGKPFPWQSVSLQHIHEILSVVLPEVGLHSQAFGFEYDKAAEAYLSRIDVTAIQPRCDALFIDEAQDMGPNTLRLLTALTLQSDQVDANSRSVNVFYDNAQNIYDRGTPKWAELGLDMRGRSTVMKESFRSTKPITEFALNVLCQLQSQEESRDHKELVERGLIERVKRDDFDWWSVRFNQVDGPKPEFRQFASLDEEFAAIAAYCKNLIQDEGVQPSDICIIYNDQYIKYRIENDVAPAMEDIGVDISVQTNQPFGRSPNCILATTSASFKGYDSEVVIVPAIDYYRAKGKGVLANNLYVAMTRARSILTLFAHRSSHPDAKTIFNAIDSCLDCLYERPPVDSTISPQDDLVDLLEIVGEKHRKWLYNLWSNHRPSQEPLLTKNGELIAEPLFWLKHEASVLACFGDKLPKQRTMQKLEDHGIAVLALGQEIESTKVND